MRHRSPATVPGHRAGLPPAHAGHRLPPEVLTPDEVHRLLRVPSSRAPTGIRNRALLAVLYRAGLRISEALALERRDINAKTGTLTVRHGKGDRHRQVGMDPEGFALLERWLDGRRRRGLARSPVVFCTLEGRPVQPSYVRQLLPRLAAKAGIEKRVHPHGYADVGTTTACATPAPPSSPSRGSRSRSSSSSSATPARTRPPSTCATSRPSSWSRPCAGGSGGHEVRFRCRGSHSPGSFPALRHDDRSRSQRRPRAGDHAPGPLNQPGDSRPGL